MPFSVAARSTAADAHSAPLLPTTPPARASACSIESQVRTPKALGDRTVVARDDDGHARRAVESLGLQDVAALGRDRIGRLDRRRHVEALTTSVAAASAAGSAI